ncbi:MAG: chemotaxis protein CheA, partial [Blastocatellia bacterium]
MMDLKGASPRERFDLKQSSRRLERQFLELEERLVELRMVSLSRTFGRATRLVDRLAHDLGKSISVEVSGRSTLLDKTIVDRVAGPLYHLLRNAIDHGIESPDERTRLGKPESGKIKLEAEIEGTRVIISISDDGRGIDPDQVLRHAEEMGAVKRGAQLTQEEILRLIFHQGFSTADQVSQVSGRGVGLDAVERAVHELGGEISITSQRGKGSQFRLAVPTTLMMISAFVVRVAEWRYAINVGQILELIQVRPSEIIGLDGKRRVKWRGLTVPLVELKFLLGLGGARRLSVSEGKSGPLRRLGLSSSASPAQHTASETSADRTRRNDNRVAAFITRVADRPIAVAVEQFDDQREVIVKSLGSLARKFRGVGGAVDL